MLPSEATALGMAIEEMERPAALERKAAGQKLGGEVVAGREASGSRDPEASAEVRTRDIAAEAIGMSEPTYRRIKQVMTTAADTGESEEVRQIARESIANIDAGAPIRPEVEKVRAAK